MSNINPTCSRCGLEVSELESNAPAAFGGHSPDQCIAALKAVITATNKNWAEAEKIISDIRRLMGTKDDEYSMRGPTTRLSPNVQRRTPIRMGSDHFVVERVVNKPKEDKP